MIHFENQHYAVSHVNQWRNSNTITQSVTAFMLIAPIKVLILNLFNKNVRFCSEQHQTFRMYYSSGSPYNVLRAVIYIQQSTLQFGP